MRIIYLFLSFLLFITSVASATEFGVVSNDPTAPSYNVYVNIKSPDKKNTYQVIREGKPVTFLNVVSVVGDFGAIMKINDLTTVNQIKKGDKVYLVKGDTNIGNPASAPDDNTVVIGKSQSTDSATPETKPADITQGLKNDLESEKIEIAANTTAVIPPFSSALKETTATPIPPKYSSSDVADWDEIIFDENDKTNLKLVPDYAWMQTKKRDDCFNSSSLIGLTAGEKKSATWSCTIPQTGIYNISLWWAAPEKGNLSSAVPVIIHSSSGDVRITIDQSINNGKFNSIGDYQFKAGANVSILTITNEGSASSGAYFCVDALKLAAK